MICGKIRTEATATEEKKIKKKGQEEEDKIKRRLTDANQEWCDWIYQKHWNKLEWINPRNRDERKIHFLCL